MGLRYVGPFRIIERVGRAAYRLDFPIYWKIYPVISINYLEPIGRLDPYGRQLPSLIPIIGINNPAIIINERKDKSGGKYLVRYDGAGRKFDRWLTAKNVKAEFLEEWQRRK